MATGRLKFRQAAIENFDLENDEQLFDIAFSDRVGALDGRYPNIEQQVLAKIAKTLTKQGKLFVDDGHPLKEMSLKAYQKHDPGLV